MDRQATIAKLAKCKHNPIQDVKVLEALKDEGLEALEAHCAARGAEFTALEERAEEAEGELKALQEKVGSSEATIKTLQADLKKAEKPMSSEDWYKRAPKEVTALVEKQRKADEEHKEELVDTLKSAQDVYDEEALKAMSIEDLDKTAKLLKLDQPAQADFSAARRIPQPRNAEDKNDPHLNPPDPWAEAVKALQARQGRSVN